MIRFHTLRREQWIARPLEEVMAFFADAHNLAELTPPWVRFRVLTPRPIQMKAGTLIRYHLYWHGVPIPWATRIRRWDPLFRFIDVELSGPYRLWHHTHRFVSKNGGTQMTDTVRYRLPFGWIGRLVHRVKVRRELEEIFEYRRRRIVELFGATKPLEVK